MSDEDTDLGLLFHSCCKKRKKKICRFWMDGWLRGILKLMGKGGTLLSLFHTRCSRVFNEN